MEQLTSKPQLIAPVAAFAPALVIFDKDGTLIDFHYMWGSWAIELARRLEATTGLPLAERLFSAMGFDPATNRIIPSGPLALDPVVEIQQLIMEVLQKAGLPAQAGEAALAATWHIPDPIELARPLADLSLLFSALRASGAKVAIATSDDRFQTEAMLAAWKLTSLVDVLVCADDGIPIKPAPDMVLTLCEALHLPPSKTLMVGDNVPDLQMGRAAGAGFTLGVLSGLASAAELAPHADLLLPSVNEFLVKI
jgi:phosphoglycolate phosphatase-like HAD superfamily hydrolase